MKTIPDSLSRLLIINDLFFPRECRTLKFMNENSENIYEFPKFDENVFDSLIHLNILRWEEEAIHEVNVTLFQS